MNPRRAQALSVAAALLALGACMAPSPPPDKGTGGSIPAPRARSSDNALLTRDCNANGVMDLFEVQHRRFDFSPAATYDTGHNNAALAAGDLDGDGDTDVATVDAEANSVSILLNNSSGVLSLDRDASIGLAAVPLRIAVGQFNADARLDMAVLFRNDEVAVFLNAGEGPPRFTLAATYRLADDETLSGGSWNNVDFVVADFDADARADIAALVTKSSYRQLVLLWNNGDGSLSAPQRISPLRPQTMNSIVALDISRDGRLDLAIGSAESGVSENRGIALVLNQGARALDYRSARDDLHYGAAGIGLSAGDLNDDGYAELLVRHADNTVSVLVNTSAGGTMGFDRDRVLSIVLARAASALTVAEVDGDGLPDLLATGDEFVSAYLNQGDLSFERAYDFAPGVAPNRLIATALNPREPVDVVAASSADHRIAVLLNASRVSRDCNLNQRPDACDITSRRSDDCNRNAVPDECDVALRVDFSPRIFAAPRAEDAMFYDPWLLVLGLNRDAHPDLLVLNGWTADYTRFFLNQLDGTFGLLRNPAEVAGWDDESQRERDNLGYALSDRGINFYRENIVAASATDLNGDGRIDLAVASLSDNSVKIIRRIARSDGDEWSSTATEVYVAGSPLRHIEAADLDADGDADLVASPYGGMGEAIVLLRNGGSGDFSHDATWDLTVTETPSSIAVSDLDRDGLPELVLSKYVAGTVTVCKNLSTAARLQFGLCTAFAAGEAPITLRVGDLNADGYPDIVVANDLSNHLSVLRNASRKGERRPLGAWQRRLAAPVALRVESATRPYPKDVALADFDGDGDLDIASANWGSDRVAILRNRGDATFLGPLVFEAGFRPESIRSADLDNDTRPDIAVANGNGDVTILLNRSMPPHSRDTNGDARPDECTP